MTTQDGRSHKNFPGATDPAAGGFKHQGIGLNEVETILFIKIALSKMTPFVLKKFC